ncbi:MAG TPA: helical backbone metal receptor [Bryobacteraceae bacterium]|nr:helical backbone metal receptor [Bryobacteraceae bacterium]
MKRALLAVLLLALCAPAQPKRIVSTFPSATETLFALGAGDRVVGVSTYCRYPPAALTLPKVGSYMKPDAEKIALLRPDLVVVEKGNTALEDRLAALHIRYVDVQYRSLADVFTMIRDIGAAVRAPARAESVNNEIRSQLDSIRGESAASPRLTVLLVVGRTPGLLTNLVVAGPSTYLSELLEIAGGVNAMKDIAIPYPHISLETVVRLNPDAILDMSMMGESGDPAVREDGLRHPWLSHRELAAAANGDVFGLTSETLVTPGPRVVEAVSEIRSRLRIVLSRKGRR